MIRANNQTKFKHDLAANSLIQSNELRAILGKVSNMWLHRHLKDGSLPQPIKISRRRFWRRDEINRFIEAESAKRSPLDGGQTSDD